MFQSLSDRLSGVLDKLTRRSETIYLPGHGGLVNDAPAFVTQYMAHRKGREHSILARLAKGEADIPTLVRAIYIGIDPRLVAAAGLSVFAHLEDLVGRGLVACEGEPSLAARYRLARGGRAG